MQCDGSFTNECRCITIDQHNANGGASSGPLQINDPWGAFAEDQLGVMDHLGIREIMVLACCIGGLFVLKLMERAPDRVVAGAFASPAATVPRTRT
jgi:pimeloyl-ACP methyl ester carboxylesterase